MQCTVERRQWERVTHTESILRQEAEERRKRVLQEEKLLQKAREGERLREILEQFRIRELELRRKTEMEEARLRALDQQQKELLEKEARIQALQKELEREEFVRQKICCLDKEVRDENMDGWINFFRMLWLINEALRIQQDFQAEQNKKRKEEEDESSGTPPPNEPDCHVYTFNQYYRGPENGDQLNGQKVEPQLLQDIDDPKPEGHNNNSTVPDRDTENRPREEQMSHQDSNDPKPEGHHRNSTVPNRGTANLPRAEQNSDPFCDAAAGLHRKPNKAPRRERENLQREHAEPELSFDYPFPASHTPRRNPIVPNSDSGNRTRAAVITIQPRSSGPAPLPQRNRVPEVSERKNYAMDDDYKKATRYKRHMECLLFNCCCWCFA